jgi:imidazolonepropionase-like amidohydrolase
MAEKGIYLVPTLSESWIIGYRGHEVGRPQWLIDASKGHLAERMGHFKHAVRAGVKMAVGTDVIGEMVDEMRLMAAGGLSNMEVIQCATKNGADLLGLQDDLGTVEVGKLADLAIMDSDPVNDLGAFSDVRLTVKGGSIYDVEAIIRNLDLTIKRPRELRPEEIAATA